MLQEPDFETTGKRSRPLALFTSDRERRFWVLALLVVAAIYASLPLGGALADALDGSVWLGIAFGLGFLMVIAAVVTGAIRPPSTGRELWIWLGIVAVYAMVVVRMGVTPAERTHLFEYGLVAVLIHAALRERFEDRTLLPAALAVAVAASLGWIDEGIQALLPDRIYDLRDAGFNALAGAMAVVATLVLSWSRGRRS